MISPSSNTPGAASQQPVIGIIGGRGRMGRWFANFLEQTGHRVLVSDIGTALAPEDLVPQCQVLILSLPMEVFPDIVARVAPCMPPDGFLTDLCSLKETQVDAMLAHAHCEVAGTHPLFGPAETALKGQRIALCPGRGKKWLTWWDTLLTRHGAQTYLVPARDHDRAMAWVQALNHFILLTLGKALEEDGIDLHHVIKLATPSFERQLSIMARLAHQSPELYATIQMVNPYTDEVLDTFTRHGEALQKMIQNRDRDAFIRLFEEVQAMGRVLLGEQT